MSIVKLIILKKQTCKPSEETSLDDYKLRFTFPFFIPNFNHPSASPRYTNCTDTVEYDKSTVFYYKKES